VFWIVKVKIPVAVPRGVRPVRIDGMAAELKPKIVFNSRLQGRMSDKKSRPLQAFPPERHSTRIKTESILGDRPLRDRENGGAGSRGESKIQSG